MPGVRPPLIPPKDAEPVGLYNGEMVYREVRKKQKKVPARDPDGNLVYRQTPSGQRGEQVFQLVPDGEEVREFVQRARRNGSVIRWYDFRESPEEIERRERRKRTAKFMDELAGKAVERGLSASDFVAVAAELGVTPDQPEEGETPDGGDAD
jgi:hypothetical protein